MTDNELLCYLIAFILGWLISRHMGNGFSVGGGGGGINCIPDLDNIYNEWDNPTDPGNNVLSHYNQCLAPLESTRDYCHGANDKETGQCKDFSADNPCKIKQYLDVYGHIVCSGKYSSCEEIEDTYNTEEQQKCSWPQEIQNKYCDYYYRPIRKASSDCPLGKTPEEYNISPASSSEDDPPDSLEPPGSGTMDSNMFNLAQELGKWAEGEM